MQGARVDLPTLAREMGVSRATAYRWAGNGELLVADVIGSLYEDSFNALKEETRSLHGAARILELTERGMRQVTTFKALRRLFEDDPKRALRLVASRNAPARKRWIARYQEVIAEEIARDHLDISVDSRTMANAITRVAESFLYADLVAGDEPDVDRAISVLRLVLGRN